ncbi:MAG TPA: T9SS type A sorting domain-containing protein [Flavobacteriaceae bacterium]|nr:T9SS type A sorting domain-containing protein [Flavobacteriaceae bacterium]
MKTATLTAVLFSVFLMPIYGQINPVENLTYWSSYTGSDTYFRLDWDVPETGNDPLVGYNIYRGNELYRFQTENFICHVIPEMDEPCMNDTGEFIWNSGNPFWTHVTAVYSTNHIESIYNDSIYIEGPLIGIKKIKKQKRILYPNPATGMVYMENEHIQKILVFDLNGKIVKKFNPKSQLDLSALPKGIYLMKLLGEEKQYVEKIVLQ